MAPTSKRTKSPSLSKRTKRYRTRRKKKAQVKKSIVTLERPLAVDATAQRLLGCAFIQTEIPKSMQCKIKRDFDFHIHAVFCTRANLYAFYYHSQDATLRLARMCRFSQTWERMIGFSFFQAEKSIQHILAIPWTRNKQVLIFINNGLRLLRMDRPEGMSMTGVDLLSMVEFPPDMVVNIELSVFVTWIAVTVDEARQQVYALAEITVGHLVSKEVGVFRLDWATMKWSRLTLEETETKKLIKGDFIAVNGSIVTIGLVERHLHPEEGYIRRYNDFEEVVALTKAIRININSLEWNFYDVTDQPNQWVLDRQVQLRFAQLGNKMYVMNALATTVDRYMTVIKNQLWVLDLNTLRMSQVNDGPVGVVRAFEPESPRAAKEREDRKVLVAVAGGDGGMVSAFFDGDVVGDEEILPPPPRTSGTSFETTTENNVAASSSTTTTLAMFEHFKNSENQKAPESGTSRTVTDVPVSKLLMRNFLLTIGSDRRDLWAVNCRKMYCPTTDQITMYRIPLWGVARLTSLTLESVLFRAPVTSLVVQSVTCSHNHTFSRVFPKQERTLEHIGRFFKKEGIPVDRLLPLTLPPILRVMPNMMPVFGAAAGIPWGFQGGRGGAARLQPWSNQLRSDDSRSDDQAAQPVTLPAIPIQFISRGEHLAPDGSYRWPMQRYLITRESAFIGSQIEGGDGSVVHLRSSGGHSPHQCPHHCSLMPFVIYRNPNFNSSSSNGVPSPVLRAVVTQSQPLNLHFLPPDTPPNIPASALIASHLAQTRGTQTTDAESALNSSTVSETQPRISSDVTEPNLQNSSTAAAATSVTLSNFAVPAPVGVNHLPHHQPSFVFNTNPPRISFAQSPPDFPRFGDVSSFSAGRAFSHCDSVLITAPVRSCGAFVTSPTLRQPPLSNPSTAVVTNSGVSQLQSQASLTPNSVISAPQPVQLNPVLTATTSTIQQRPASEVASTTRTPSPPSLPQPSIAPNSSDLSSTVTSTTYNVLQQIISATAHLSQALSTASPTINPRANSLGARAALEMPTQGAAQVQALVYGRPAEVVAEVITPINFVPIRVEGLTPEHFRIRQPEEIILTRPYPRVLSAQEPDLSVPRIIIHVPEISGNSGGNATAVNTGNTGNLYRMQVPLS